MHDENKMKEDSPKKKRKGFKILIIVLGVILVLAIGGLVAFNIYRYPAKFRDLKNTSLGADKTAELKKEILAKEDPNILVAYFSYSGTTKGVAESIASSTGGTLFEIKTVKTYSSVYTESNREIRKNERPELSGTVQDMDKYDIVFVGYPVWWHATPVPINTFLENYDLKGKLIIPFCTSGESQIDETLPTFLDSCDGLAVYEGKRLNAAGVSAWIEELGIKLR